MTQAEKRKNTRVVFCKEATVRFADRVFPGLVIKDLSRRGVYLEGISGRQQGEKCEIVFNLNGASDEIELSMSGKVVHQEVNGIGIQFLETDVDTFFHLKNIVYFNASNPDQIEEENGFNENIPEDSFVN